MENEDDENDRAKDINWQANDIDRSAQQTQTQQRVENLGMPNDESGTFLEEISMPLTPQEISPRIVQNQEGNMFLLEGEYSPSRHHQSLGFDQQSYNSQQQVQEQQQEDNLLSPSYLGFSAATAISGRRMRGQGNSLMETGANNAISSSFGNTTSDSQTTIPQSSSNTNDLQQMWFSLQTDEADFSATAASIQPDPLPDNFRSNFSPMTHQQSGQQQQQGMTIADFRLGSFPHAAALDNSAVATTNAAVGNLMHSGIFNFNQMAEMNSIPILHQGSYQPFLGGGTQQTGMNNFLMQADNMLSFNQAAPVMNTFSERKTSGEDPSQEQLVTENAAGLGKAPVNYNAGGMHAKTSGEGVLPHPNFPFLAQKGTEERMGFLSSDAPLSSAPSPSVESIIQQQQYALNLEASSLRHEGNSIIQKRIGDHEISLRSTKVKDASTFSMKPINDYIVADREKVDKHSGRPPVPIFLPYDEDNLSEYQCLVRKHIELFEAGPVDVESNGRGRNKPVVLGQVGIRCRHCSMLPPKQRAKASTYYPAKLSGLYQAAQSMASVHLCMGECRYLPKEVRQELLVLREKKSSAGGGKKYWSDGITVLGVYEDESGLKFRDK